MTAEKVSLDYRTFPGFLSELSHEAYVVPPHRLTVLVNDLLITPVRRLHLLYILSTNHDAPSPTREDVFRGIFGLRRELPPRTLTMILVDHWLGRIFPGTVDPGHQSDIFVGFEDVVHGVESVRMKDDIVIPVEDVLGIQFDASLGHAIASIGREPPLLEQVAYRRVQRDDDIGNGDCPLRRNESLIPYLCVNPLSMILTFTLRVTTLRYWKMLLLCLPADGTAEHDLRRLLGQLDLSASSALVRTLIPSSSLRLFACLT